MTPCAVEASGRGSSITPPLRPAHASRLISEKRALIQLNSRAGSLGRDRTHAVPVRSVGPCGYPAAYTQDPAARRSDSRYDDPRRGSRVVREVAHLRLDARRGRENPPGRTQRGGGTALARDTWTTTAARSRCAVHEPTARGTRRCPEPSRNRAFQQGHRCSSLTSSGDSALSASVAFHRSPSLEAELLSRAASPARLFDRSLQSF